MINPMENCRMIKATDKAWNSPTTLYIARRLQSFAKGKTLSVLDMGCGDGAILENLIDYGYDLYGYDFPESSPSLKKRLTPYFGRSYDKHIRMAKDERSIPFDDDSFDVIYANQVFEHIRFLDKMLQECNRVLRPDGALLTVFPLATCPIEPHIGIPFAHWIPPGNVRIQYLRLFYALGLRPKSKRSSSLETGIQQNIYLREKTFYRFLNEILSLSTYYFESCECETSFLIRAKLDLMKIDKKPIYRWLNSFMGLLEGNKLDYLVTHLVNAAFCMTSPRKSLNY